MAANEAEAASLLGPAAGRAVLVGDTVSHTLCRVGVTPRVHVIDLHAKRRRVETLPPCPYDRMVVVENPPGMISLPAAEALLEALRSPCRTRVVVEGEEDLLSLLLVAEAGEAVVVYGQPGAGIVIVDASREEYRDAARAVLEEMSREN